ncbi:MAG: DUF2079 domain-containing protein [Flavobacteriales bacterium]
MSILAGFAVLYACIWVPNHLLFRTYALDLGLYTHALWQYAHGHPADTALFLHDVQPLLADHFDLYLPLLSPLVLILGTWTLLVVQWAAILFGAWGIRRTLLLMGAGPRPAMVGMVVFLAYFGVFTAVAFDYHSSVVAAMFLPWFIAAMVQGRTGQGILWFLLMLIAKENIGLWIGVVALVLSNVSCVPGRMRAACYGLGALGFAWSALVIGCIMPSLAADGAYAHADYSIVLEGTEGPLQKVVGMLTALFTDHVGVPDGTAIKLEFWVMLLLAGGWALLLRPVWGIMALPLLAQKMLHDDPGKWSVVAHYAVEFAPLIAIAVGLSVQHWSGRAWSTVLVVVFSLATTARCMDNTIAYQDRSRIRFYQAEHWHRNHDTMPVEQAMRTIPPDASVSASSPAIPHLACRDQVFQFPILRDAQWVLVMPLESPYPLTTAGSKAVVDSLRKEGWSTRMETLEVILLERP